MNYVKNQALRDGRFCARGAAALLTLGALHFGLGAYATNVIDPVEVEYQLVKGQELGGATLGALGLGAVYMSRRLTRQKEE